MPNHRDRAINICIILLTITTICYLSAFLMHRDCKYGVLRVGKRCNLPIKSQTILKTLEENVVDAEELLSMEDEWLTFRAKLSFSAKDNKVSVEIVRFHSTKKDTSDWRMDPASATTGDQWFTIKGRWNGQPLSFEFAQTDSKIVTVPEMMTQESELERNVPKVNDENTGSSHVEQATDKHSSDISPVMESLNTSNLENTSSRQSIAEENAPIDEIWRPSHAVQPTCPIQEYMPKCPLFQDYNQSYIEQDISYQTLNAFETEDPQDSLQEHATQERQHLVTSDICPAMESFNNSSNWKTTLLQPTITKEKTPVSLNTDKFWRSSHAGGQTLQPKCPRREYMAKCPLFREYNESHAEHYTSYETTHAFEAEQPQKRSLEEPGSENEVNADTSSMVPVKSLDVYCSWYSPTDVMVGAAIVVTVTATVATSYVILACPNSFGAH